METVSGDSGGRSELLRADICAGTGTYSAGAAGIFTGTLLLPYLDFCALDDPVYQNTVRQIRTPEYPYSFAGCAFAEIGCAHAPHPWMLSVANSLLSGQAERALDILRRAEMDNGIVCESIDEHTGRSATGEAFATCAGFVCHALRYALGGTAYEN